MQNSDMTLVPGRRGNYSQYKNEKKTYDYSVFMTAQFILFCVLCKIIYLSIMLLAVLTKKLEFATVVFLPELCSLAFLTGAFITELFVLMLVHHRV